MNKKNLKRSNNNLIPFIANKELLLICYKKVKQWKLKKSLSKQNLTTIIHIQFKIAKGFYLWNGIKQNNWFCSRQVFKDLVVQEAIRVVLSTIYKPLFYWIMKSQVFIYSLQTYLKKMRDVKFNITTIVWNKIKYTKLKTWTFIKILKRKVDDKKFLSLIVNLILKTSALQKSAQSNSINLIFLNIYLHTFDVYVKILLNKLTVYYWKQNLQYFKICSNYLLCQKSREKNQLIKFWQLNIFKSKKIQKWDLLHVKTRKQITFEIEFIRYFTYWVLLTNVRGRKALKISRSKNSLMSDKDVDELSSF